MNSAVYLCSPSPDSSELAPHNLHPLADLFFCPNCTRLRSMDQCVASITCKYCPSCMEDYTDSPGATRCAKSCFECPECSSPLTIAVTDEKKAGVPGKSFSFSCGYCSYHYKTQTVTKPAPLGTIVKNENPSYFSVLHEKYTLAYKLRNGPQPTLSPETLSKMAQMKIGPKTDHDALAYKLAQFEPRSIDIDGDFRSKTEKALPLGTHLVAKRAYSCRECNAHLLTPVADPRSMKHLKKELAMDVVPVVTATEMSGTKSTEPGIDGNSKDGSEIDCVLSVVNPLPSSVNVTLSTLEKIPQNVSETPFPVSVSVPTTSFVVGGRRERAGVLGSVPTVYLTEATAASRGELLTRAIRRESERRADPEAVEKGPNWVSVPISVAFDQKESGHFVEKVKLPFYVVVETRTPDHWKKSAKKGLKYGFWVVCPVHISPEK